MFSALRPTAVAGFAVMVVATAGAQDTREQAARVDSFARALREVIARRVAFDDSAARNRKAMDSLRVGPFRMLVQEGAQDLATRAAQLAADSLAPIGPTAMALIAKHQFVVRRTPSARWENTSVPSIVVAVLDSQRVERMQLWSPTTDAKVVARWFYQDAMHLLAGEFDSTFTRWLIAQVLFDSVSAFSWTQFRLDLVSSPSSAARACYEGNMVPCRKILGLTPTADPVLEWFDAAARRKVVERLGHDIRRIDYSGTDRCLAGVDSACISVLQRSKQISPVALSGHRVALVQLALQMGGQESLARLLTAKGTPAERIADAAGVSADSVVRVWHGRVRNVRIPSDDMSLVIAAASLGWIGLLGALALRNSKWR